MKTFNEMTDSQRINQIRLICVHFAANDGRDSTHARLLSWAVDELERLNRMTAERSALIGQRIVEDGEGRGWWAYDGAPEGQQGFPEPNLYPTFSDAEKAVLAVGEPD